MRLDFASDALNNVSGCVNSVSRQLKKLYSSDADCVYKKRFGRGMRKLRDDVVLLGTQQICYRGGF